MANFCSVSAVKGLNDTFQMDVLLDDLNFAMCTAGCLLHVGVCHLLGEAQTNKFFFLP